VEGTPTQPLMTFLLTCILGNTLSTHSFLVLPNCPTPLLGRDILSKFQATFTLHPPLLKSRPINPLSPSSQPLLAIMGALLPQAPPDPLPLPATLVDPIVWDLQNSAVATHHEPIFITLKDSSVFPNQPQYHISLIHLQGLKPIISELLSKGPSSPNPFPL
jgi:hypothetical protein